MVKRIHSHSEAQDRDRKGWTDRVKGPDKSLKPKTVVVKWQPNMPKAQFARKAQKLRTMSRRGELYKASNPVSRDGNITFDYRGALIRKIYNNNRDNPDLARAAHAAVDSMHPDHISELQTGGRDHWENLQMLDADTNTEIGRKIWQAIMHEPDGTPIKIKVKW
ncbi:hypothetical protein ACFY00_00375 [Kitasatospora sp. NPDC001540]|uniref:hypothetical protein n=1 Tax=Kitasatospora sp. NPDC001540 TaxID=3364014 RepID=UPI0036B1A496